MPKKGRRNTADSERESGKTWKKLKDRHSVVESARHSDEEKSLTSAARRDQNWPMG